MSQLNETQDEELEKAYITEVQEQTVSPADLKTVLMAILKFNDGKHFFNASESPLPQSEFEVGFRRPEGPEGVFYLRYEEIPQIQKSFEQFYTNRLQLLGLRMEAMRNLKVQIETQKQQEGAKPQLSSKTDEFAARYRAKQLSKKTNESASTTD